MEVCWCGCGAEWSSETAWDWAATEEWANYAEPYAEPAYSEPIVYADPFVTDPTIYTEPIVYDDPFVTDPIIYTEPVYTEPSVEAAPLADPGIAIVGGPTAGFDQVVMEPAPPADPGIAIVGGPTPGVTTDVIVTEAPSGVVASPGVAVIGGTPLDEYDISATAWDKSWDIFLNNRATTSGDPIADQVIASDIATRAMNRIDISLSNAGMFQTTWGTPSSDFSYNSSGRLVNNPYYNDFKP